ncbi:MAG: pyrroloquinoline quinone biosynthesis peptide chaperone PqqD [Motiliproteus sp.]|nr:pyrroloquinoline quinone biosynthesis peptide chaperone PqqD [Motiliproteus sp.]MCW9054140.1 pyrroloquinoline quinone biosynthesis peptide chaperone PqqD [Motiliproteus sp.]
MSTQHQVQMQDRYEINPLFLFRWEESQESHVLLYPEGVVKLNQTAATILKHCDGELTVDQFITEIANEFDQTDPEVIAQSVVKFLEASHDKGWIRAKN